MKPTDPNPDRVWQRVLSPEPKEQQTLQLLLRQLSLDIVYLSQRNKLPEDPVAALLIREYTGQLHSLKGILLLSGSSIPREATEAAGHSLRRCFDHALHRLSQYQLRASDPVYGPVFRELAAQTGQHCFRLTQLLGKRLHEGKEKGR